MLFAPKNYWQIIESDLNLLLLLFLYCAALIYNILWLLSFMFPNNLTTNSLSLGIASEDITITTEQSGITTNKIIYYTLYKHCALHILQFTLFFYII